MNKSENYNIQNMWVEIFVTRPCENTLDYFQRNGRSIHPDKSLLVHICVIIVAC